MRTIPILTALLCVGLQACAPDSAEYRPSKQPLISQTFRVGDGQMRFDAGEGQLVDKKDANPDSLPIRWLTFTDVNPAGGKLLYREVVQDWPLGAVQFNADKEVLVTYWESSTTYRVMAFRTKANAVTKIFDAHSKTIPGVKLNASGDIVFELSKDCAGGATDCHLAEHIVRLGVD